MRIHSKAKSLLPLIMLFALCVCAFAQGESAKPQKNAQRARTAVITKDGLSSINAEYMALKKTPLAEIETEDAVGEPETEETPEGLSLSAAPAPQAAAATASAAVSKDMPAGKVEAPADVFGIPRPWLGVMAVALLIIMIADFCVFTVILALKWNALGGFAKCALALSCLVSNAIIFALMAGSALAFLAASKPAETAATQPPTAALPPPASVEQSQPQNEEELALKAFQSAPDEAGAQLLSAIRDRMARDFATRAIAGNDAELYKKAIQYADSAATLSPSDPKKWLLAGALYARINECPDAQDAAAERLEKAYALAPESAEIRLSLGETCVRLGRDKEALDLFESVVAETPKAATPELVKAMAVCYMRKHLYNRCAAFFGALLADNPQNAAARITLATALRELGDSKKADAELRAVAAGPGAPPEMKAYAKKLLAAWGSNGKGGAE